ncbi:hypothetical protein [Sphingobium sp. Z007]|uniref:hypothetical protein n=1 Tax=Sphingobium sp. Z007 TaxID=627495 RepID=UPI000B49766F|nr:hypothetical protein [Sphingobium sp. Z007]
MTPFEFLGLICASAAIGSAIGALTCNLYFGKRRAAVESLIVGESGPDFAHGCARPRTGRITAAAEPVDGGAMVQFFRNGEPHGPAIFKEGEDTAEAARALSIPPAPKENPIMDDGDIKLRLRCIDMALRLPERADGGVIVDAQRFYDFATNKASADKVPADAR